MKGRSADDEVSEIIREEHLFQLKAIKTRAQLEEVDRGEMIDRDTDGELHVGVEGSSVRQKYAATCRLCFCVWFPVAFY